MVSDILCAALSALLITNGSRNFSTFLVVSSPLGTTWTSARDRPHCASSVCFHLSEEPYAPCCSGYWWLGYTISSTRPSPIGLPTHYCQHAGLGGFNGCLCRWIAALTRSTIRTAILWMLGTESASGALALYLECSMLSPEIFVEHSIHTSWSGYLSLFNI